MGSGRPTRRTVLGGVAAAGALAALPIPSAAAEGTAEVKALPTFSLRNARILLGDGAVVEGGVRVEGGRIVEVGPGVKDGRDLGGATLFPGFHDGGSTLGLVEIDQEGATHDQGEGSEAIVPQVRVVDGYNPRSALIPVARLGGVLGALVTPDGGALVSGQAAWVRLAGDTVGDAVLAAPAAVCFALGHAATGGVPGSPKSRMGVAAKIRDLLDQNEPPKEETETKGVLWWRHEVPKPPKDEKPTRAQKVVRALRRRETKAIFAADRADDILVALDLAREYQLDAVLLGAAEAHLVAPAIADAGVPVLYGPVTVQPDSFDHLHARYETPAVLHDAGVRFALRKGGPHNLRDIGTEACVAVAHGLPWEAAVAATTGNAPGFWKLEVGRIAPGFEATFALADGDPLQPRTAITGIWMRGEEVPLRSRQTDLYERYRTLR